MISVLKIKYILKISYLWCKKNIVSIVLSILLSMLLIKSMTDKKNNEAQIKNLRKLLDKAREDFEVSRKNHRQEIIRRELLEKAYLEKMKQVEEKYNFEINKINNQQKLRIEELLEQNHTPREMEEKISSILGIKPRE